MKTSIYLLFILGFIACAQSEHSPINDNPETKVRLIVLGTIQDAGSPHIGCTKSCCQGLFSNPPKDRKVVSLGIVDRENKKKYLFEASPDIGTQLKLLKSKADFNHKEMPDGIFLTHAHIGHYAGLMYLGKEAISAPEVPVYAMPRMDSFLRNNGPWSQLVNDQNIYLKSIHANDTITLTSNLRVVPFIVPHRDEYSETVGYTIIGPNKSVLFIPDIDKWTKWDKRIEHEIKKVDYAFVDATFYSGEEIKARDISQIPHPFVIESMELFDGLSISDKAKIHFIHFNHTNPLLDPESAELKKVIKEGFKVATYHQQIEL